MLGTFAMRKHILAEAVNVYLGSSMPQIELSDHACRSNCLHPIIIFCVHGNSVSSDTKELR